MLANPLLRRGLVLLLIAAVGFSAVRIMKRRARGGLGPPRAHTVNVVYAAVDIPPQTVLTPELLRLESMPEKEAGGYLTVKSIDEVNGYVTRFPIIRDYPIQKDLLAGRIDQLGLSYMIPPGRRAMIIELKKEPNFFDMIKTNDHVDVVATYPTGTDPLYSRTIVTDALVLAVNTMIDKFDVAQRNKAEQVPAQGKAKTTAKAGKTGKAEEGAESATPPPPPKNITLAVTPEDAVRIAVSNKAMLDIILRPREEFGWGAPVAPPAEGTGTTGTTTPAAPAGGEKIGEKGIGGKGPKIALYEVAPPLKSLLPKKGTGASGGIQRQPPRVVTPLPPVPRRTHVPPVSPTPAVRPPVVPMTPISPPPLPSAPSNTYEVQVFAGSNKSTVEVKRPPT